MKSVFKKNGLCWHVKQSLDLSLQHERCLSICRYIRLHHDEYCWTLYSFRCGMGSYRQIHCDFCVLVEPQGTYSFFFSFLFQRYWQVLLVRKKKCLSLVIRLVPGTIVLCLFLNISIYLGHWLHWLSKVSSERAVYKSKPSILFLNVRCLYLFRTWSSVWELDFRVVHTVLCLLSCGSGHCTVILFCTSTEWVF